MMEWQLLGRSPGGDGPAAAAAAAALCELASNREDGHGVHFVLVVIISNDGKRWITIQKLLLPSAVAAASPQRGRGRSLNKKNKLALQYAATDKCLIITMAVCASQLLWSLLPAHHGVHKLPPSPTSLGESVLPCVLQQN